jgi:hypothetical protein
MNLKVAWGLTDYFSGFPLGLKQLELEVNREQIISKSTYAFDEYSEAKFDLDGTFIETSCWHNETNETVLLLT